MKELFRRKRQEKIDAQQSTINAMTKRLNELLNAPESTKENKRKKRKRKIAKLQTKIANLQAEIAKYNSLDEHNRTQVFEYLDKWRKRGEPMSSDVVTKFTDNQVMEEVILEILKKHQADIDNALTDSSGKSKPVGTTYPISDTITQTGVGVGY
jgi:DNA repair exonuclease SbcCD ATPase subunit